MKKKCLVAIAVLATLAMSIGMFAGCAPTSPGEYLEKMKTATVGTTEVTMDGKLFMSISDNGEEFSLVMRDITENEEAVCYAVKEGKKLVMYSKEPLGKWEYTEDIKAIEEAMPNKSNAEMVEKFSTKKEDYDIADGVWTHKILKYTLKVEAGKLVIEDTEIGIKTKIVFDAKKPNISVPKEVKEATKK